MAIYLDQFCIVGLVRELCLCQMLALNRDARKILRCQKKNLAKFCKISVFGLQSILLWQRDMVENLSDCSHIMLPSPCEYVYEK